MLVALEADHRTTPRPAQVGVAGSGGRASRVQGDRPHDLRRVDALRATEPAQPAHDATPQDDATPEKPCARKCAEQVIAKTTRAEALKGVQESVSTRGLRGSN